MSLCYSLSLSLSLSLSFYKVTEIAHAVRLPVPAAVNMLRTTTLQKCVVVQGWLVFEAHRLFYHSTLGLRVIKKKKKKTRGHETSRFVKGFRFQG